MISVITIVRVLASKQTPCPSGAEVTFWALAFLPDEFLRGDKEDAVRLLPGMAHASIHTVSTQDLQG